MPTSISPLLADQIIRANSGAYYLLLEDGGRTGNLNLIGSSYIQHESAGTLAVQNNAFITGSQTTYGDIVGFNLNKFAKIISTGASYLANVTGQSTFSDLNATGISTIRQISNGLRISGNLESIGEINVTGVINSTGNVNIGGSLFVNGVQITGNGAGGLQTGYYTGDIVSLFNNKGDLIVGTGIGQTLIFGTGSAQSGNSLIYDPTTSSSLRWGSSVGAGAGLSYLQEGTGIVKYSVFADTQFVSLGVTGANQSFNISAIGDGSFIFGQTGLNTLSSANNMFIFGSGNGIRAGARTSLFGANNTAISASYSMAVGTGNSLLGNQSYAFGAGNLSLANSFCFGKESAAHNEYEINHGCGGFSGLVGSAQASTSVFKVETTDNTVTALATVSIGSVASTTFDILITAFSDLAGGNAAGYHIRGVIKDHAGVTSFVGTPTVTVLAEDDASWDVAVVDTLANFLTINVTGPVADTVRWVGRMDSVTTKF